MSHYCINLPAGAHYNGRKILNDKNENVAWQGHGSLDGRKFEVEKGEIFWLKDRSQPRLPIDQPKLDLLQRLMTRPDVFPDRLIVSAMDKAKTSTAAIHKRQKENPLPNKRLLTDDERLIMAQNIAWFDMIQLEKYGAQLGQKETA